MESSSLPSTLGVLPRSDAFFISRHGYKLVVTRWQAPRNVVGRVLFSHGYTHYTGAMFEHLAALFALFDLECFSVEHFGHGRSDGMRAFMPSADAVVDDFCDFASVIKEGGFQSSAQGAPRPLFVYAESMGGAIATRSALRHPRLFRGLVMMAPMLGFDSARRPSALVETIGEIISFAWPSAPLLPQKDMVYHCFRDPDMCAAVIGDVGGHRYKGPVRIGTALQFREITDRIQASAHEMHCPFIIFHGSDDLITSPACSKRFFFHAATEDKTFVDVTGALHVIWWERQSTRERYFWRVLQWIQQRCDDGGTPPAVDPTDRVAALPSEVAESAARADRTRAPHILRPHTRGLPPGHIETFAAAVEGPFRVPGHPLSGWTGGMVVEGTDGRTLLQRYLEADPSRAHVSGMLAPPSLTWDAAVSNRTRVPAGGPASHARQGFWL